MKECYHGKTFYVISINKTDKGFKKWCLFMSRGLGGQGAWGTSVPMTND